LFSRGTFVFSALRTSMSFLILSISCFDLLIATAASKEFSRTLISLLIAAISLSVLTFFPGASNLSFKV
jgi:hypothetical protein